MKTQTNSQQTEGAVAVRSSDLLACASLGQYLKHYQARGVIDFCVRINPANCTADSIEFYIRPAGVDGDTRDYITGTEGRMNVTSAELCNRLLHAVGLAG